MNDREHKEAITATPAPALRPETPAAGAARRPAPSSVWFLLSILFVVLVSGLGVFAAGWLFVIEAEKLALAVLVVGAVVMLVLAFWPLFSRTRGKWWRVLAPLTVGVGSLAGWSVLAVFALGALYVVPTGGMAPTFLGFHRQVTCPKCGHVFAVNASAEAEPVGGVAHEVIGCTCPNCLIELDFRRAQAKPPIAGGDRVAVSRFLFGRGPEDLQPFQVMVFDFPPSVEEGKPKRYFKRVVGFGGQTLAIHNGDLFTCNELSYADDDVAATDLWQIQHTHQDDERARQLFQDGKFTILRKSPKLILALRQLVYDNDCQPTDLALVRWSNSGLWSAKDNGFTHSGQRKEIEWLRYQHILRPSVRLRLVPLDREQEPPLKPKPRGPQLITDYSGYNSCRLEFEEHARGFMPAQWVGDLLLECRLNVLKAHGEFVLELAKGPDRFRAQWLLASGECRLSRLEADGKASELAKANTRVNQAGQFRLRFANVDQRLVVWVDDELPFGDGISYAAPKTHGPTANDLEPVSIGSQGAAVEVRSLKVWRDTHYVGDTHPGADFLADEDNRSDPARWDELRNLKPRTFYVQPGHYFVLGDNSQQSYDSRSWGVVPERLAFGRARLIYAPGARFGWIK